jgi:hypothetical protein
MVVLCAFMYKRKWHFVISPTMPNSGRLKLWRNDSDRTTVTKPGPTETSQEGLFNSLFTGLVIAALEGGGGDIRGHVSADSA